MPDRSAPIAPREFYLIALGLEPGKEGLELSLGGRGDGDVVALAEGDFARMGFRRQEQKRDNQRAL